MNYLVSEQNAFFGDKALKNEIKIKEMYGQDLDDYPSKETLLSFKEMVDARMVGDPNDILAFDAKYHQAAFTDIQQVRDISVKLSDSVLFPVYAAHRKTFLLIKNRIGGFVSSQ